MRKLISGVLLTLIFTTLLSLTLTIQSAKAQTLVVIYIRADGSIDPPTAPIERNGNIYTFTGDINGSIVVEKDNIILDGNNHVLQGNGTVNGINCPEYAKFRSNVTIKNIFIKHFSDGIYCYNSSNTVITNVTVTDCDMGIWLPRGSNVNVTNNIARNNNVGMEVAYCSGIVARNLIIYNGYGLNVIDPDVIENRIINNSVAIYTVLSRGGTWIGNDIINNTKAVKADLGYMIVHHNNFINNSILADFFESTGTWDDGYPSGGNYWSNYNGTDLYSGPSQDIPGSDGIGDTSYVIDVNNRDRYPLMTPLVHITTGSNVTVFPVADVGLTFENVTKTGLTSAYKTDTLPDWLPSLPRLVGEYIDITVSAGHFGKITIKITYDDSNMTEEEENGLQLLQWSGCDVTGPTPGVLDGIINMRDIGVFCSKFMIPSGSDEWEPRCDVTGPIPGVPDGICNMRDIGETCSNFMGTNQWTDITMYIDTENNVIYGETTHFSMFGVTRE